MLLTLSQPAALVSVQVAVAINCVGITVLLFQCYYHMSQPAALVSVQVAVLLEDVYVTPSIQV